MLHAPIRNFATRFSLYKTRSSPPLETNWKFHNQQDDSVTINVSESSRIFLIIAN